MKWIKLWAREYGVMYSEIAILSFFKDVKHIIPYVLKNMCILPEQKNECFYVDEKEWEHLKKSLIVQFAKNKKVFGNFSKLFHSIGKKYVELAKKLSSQNLSELDKKDLQKGFFDYFLIWRDYCCVLWVGWLLNECFSEIGLEIVEKKVKKLGKEDKLYDLKNTIFESTKKSDVNILQDKIKKLKEKGYDKEDIKALWKEFAWMPCLDVHNKPWTKKDIKEYIQNFRVEEKKLLNYKKIMKELDFSKKEREILDIAKELVYIKDVRDDYRRKGVCFIQPYLTEIAKRRGLRLEDISYLMSNEIFKKISKEKIEKRKKGFLLYYEKGKFVCISNKKDVELALKKKFGIIQKEIKEKEIKGLAVSKGKVKGTVKIVRGISDLAKVEKGDILVSITTHPDFLPAMHLTAAIVTDEGGMTSHAAIVSRELKIPCIVGTKIATKVLKDGDKVEIDTDRGVVKKIK